MGEQETLAPVTPSSSPSSDTAVVGNGVDDGGTPITCVVKALRKRLYQHNKNRRTVQDELVSTCSKLRDQIKELEEGMNEELEKAFA